MNVYNIAFTNLDWLNNKTIELLTALKHEGAVELCTRSEHRRTTKFSLNTVKDKSKYVLNSPDSNKTLLAVMALFFLKNETIIECSRTLLQ